MEALEQASSAAVGGAIATFLCYPLDALRTKQAVMVGGKKESATTTLVRILHNHGVQGLWSGVSPKLAQSVIGKFLYFLWYTALTQKYGAFKGAKLSTTESLVCGYFAEALHLPLSIPFEVVTTRVQKSAPGTSVSATVSSLLHEGPSSLWRGWRAYIFLCSQPAIQFVAFERMKGGATSVSAWRAFWLGALARALAVLLTFPFTRARTIIQAQEGNKKKDDDAKEGNGGSGSGGSKSILGLLLQLVREEGVGSLYRGLYPELLRGVLSSAIMLSVKERVNIKFR